jgi:hypothetical protein
MPANLSALGTYPTFTKAAWLLVLGRSSDASFNTSARAMETGEPLAGVSAANMTHFPGENCHTTLVQALFSNPGGTFASEK